jgi:hypothetical protein
MRIVKEKDSSFLKEYYKLDWIEKSYFEKNGDNRIALHASTGEHTAMRLLLLLYKNIIIQALFIVLS